MHTYVRGIKLNFGACSRQVRRFGVIWRAMKLGDRHCKLCVHPREEAEKPTAFQLRHPVYGSRSNVIWACFERVLTITGDDGTRSMKLEAFSKVTFLTKSKRAAKYPL